MWKSTIIVYARTILSENEVSLKNKNFDTLIGIN
jgi:hypothetical protein